MNNQQLLQQARAAIQAGDKQTARHLLQQAVTQQPDDFAAWLWLASVAASPLASMEYVERAEALNPTHPTVLKAKAWAQRRLPKEAAPAAKRAAPRRINWTLAGSLLFLLLLLGVTTAVLYDPSLLSHRQQVPETAVLAQIQPTAQTDPSPNDGVHDAPTEEPTATAVPTSSPTPAPTERPERLLAKNVSSSGQPLPTWTPTPLPTNTPVPSPTPAPTFVSAQTSNWVGKRPFGVGENERWIDVNLSTQSLNAFEGDTLVYSALVSSGLANFPTVTGQFRTWIKYESQTMDGRLLGYDYYLENVPYVMYFYQDYAIHGAYWHNNFGTPMSHGCVNVSIPDSQWLFTWAPLGTLVNVHY